MTSHDIITSCMNNKPLQCCLISCHFQYLLCEIRQHVVSKAKNLALFLVPKCLILPTALSATSIS